MHQNGEALERKLKDIDESSEIIDRSDEGRRSSVGRRRVGNRRPHRFGLAWMDSNAGTRHT